MTPSDVERLAAVLSEIRGLCEPIARQGRDTPRVKLARRVLAAIDDAALRGVSGDA